MRRPEFSLSGLLMFVALCGLLLGLAATINSAVDGSHTIVSLESSANGRVLAVGLLDGSVRFVDGESGRSLGVTRHSDSTLQGVLAPDGTLYARADGHPGAFAGQWVEELAVFDIASGREVARGQIPVNQAGFAFTRDGRRLILYSPAAGEVVSWNIESRAIERRIPAPAPNGAATTRARFSADGRVVAAIHSFIDRPMEIEVRAAESGTLLATFPGGEWDAWSNDISMSHDGWTLAVLDLSGTGVLGSVNVWDVHDAERKPRIRTANDWSHSVALTADGKWLAIAGENFEIWDVEAGRMRRAFPNESVYSLAAAPDADLWFTSNGREVVRWDARSLERIGTVWTADISRRLAMLCGGVAIWFVLWRVRRTKARRPDCILRGDPVVARRAKKPVVCPSCSVKRLPAARQVKKNRRVLAVLVMLMLVLAGAVGAVQSSWTLPLAVLAAALLLAAYIGILILRAKIKVWWAGGDRGTNFARKIAREAREERYADQIKGWFAEGTTLADRVPDCLARARGRFAAYTGREPSDDGPLSILAFARRADQAAWLKRLGVVPFDAPSLYVLVPWRPIVVAEETCRDQLIEPADALSASLALHFVERSLGTEGWNWIGLGLSRLISRDIGPAALDGQRRKLAAALAAGKTLGAEIFEVTMKDLVAKARQTYCQQDFAFSWLFHLQSASLVEFLAGETATPDRRAAFRAHFAGDRRTDAIDRPLLRQIRRRPDHLLHEWRMWLTERPVPPAEPPSQFVREALMDHVLPWVGNLAMPVVDRLRAVRAMGERGLLLGAEALVAIVNNPAEQECLRAAAEWSLEQIAAVPRSEVGDWESWLRSIQPQPIETA